MKTIAILIADIHLSAKPPSARAAEPDWFKAMGRQLDQLESLAERESAPILCAGDIFHRFNPPPKLINFAIDRLPEMWAVAGQHDLPHHRMQDIESSAFWTLFREGTINLLTGDLTLGIGDWIVRGFSWGAEILPPTHSSKRSKHLALIHRYCCTPETSHPEADQSSYVSNMKRMLDGYDVAVFGDNHIPFDAKAGDCRVHNCGAFFRRSRKEKDHRPSAGLLKEDGTIERHYFDVSEDEFAEDQVTGDNISEEEKRRIDRLVEELRDTHSDELDFVGAVRRLAGRDDVSPDAQKLLLEAIE